MCHPPTSPCDGWCPHQCPNDLANLRGVHIINVWFLFHTPIFLFFFYKLLPLRLQNKKKWFAVLSSNNPPSLIGDKFEAGKLRTTSNKENKNTMTQCRKASNVTGEFV